MMVCTHVLKWRCIAEFVPRLMYERGDGHPQALTLQIIAGSPSRKGQLARAAPSAISPRGQCSSPGWEPARERPQPPAWRVPPAAWACAPPSPPRPRNQGQRPSRPRRARAAHGLSPLPASTADPSRDRSPGRLPRTGRANRQVVAAHHATYLGDRRLQL